MERAGSSCSFVLALLREHFFASLHYAGPALSVVSLTGRWCRRPAPKFTGLLQIACESKNTLPRSWSSSRQLNLSGDAMNNRKQYSLPLALLTLCALSVPAAAADDDLVSEGQK